MSLSPLPLSYCTNVHAGRSLVEVQRGLDDYTVPVRGNYGAPLATGLWLAAPVVQEVLAEQDGIARLGDFLRTRDLTCHTLNAFPYGDFHSKRVKEQVYLPDWSDPRRLDYTLRCATILAGLLDEGAEGSISTLPLAFKPVFPDEPAIADFRQRCLPLLLQAAAGLQRLHEQTGRLIRLAIEPEPWCVLETTAETLVFFAELRAAAEAQNLLAAVKTHLGVCFDVCHQAVEFEDIANSIEQLQAAEIRINKLHITCAIRLTDPARNTAARTALARYVEERYLHQTLAHVRTGEMVRQVDLTEELALQPPEQFRTADEWRVHFHVPVDAEHLGPLETTRDSLKQAIQVVAGLDYAPHLEVETYTWEVLPDNGTDLNTRLVDGLTRELHATRQLLK